jgi:HD-like signal output (HDOD) protein
MSDNKIDQIIAGIKKLPPLNYVVQRLLEVVRDESSSAKDITDVLSGDQAIASKVLELVNSSFYGFPDESGL